MSAGSKIIKGALGARNTTPQTEQADARQVKNFAGGYSFEVTGQSRLRRALVLGTTGSSFYASQGALAKENLKEIEQIVATDGLASVLTILDVSERGLAPKQDMTLAALAVAASAQDEATRAAALAALPKVARTATMLFDFLTYVKQFRGTGRALRKALGAWYTDKTPDASALQVSKYRQRNGWTHRDVLRIAHPVTSDPAHAAVFQFALKGDVSDAAPTILHAYAAAQGLDDTRALAALVTGNKAVSWEHLPTEALRSPEVWEAFLDRGMPLTALIRNLPRLTELGVLKPLGRLTQTVVETLTDKEALRKARIHPIQVLVAQRQYATGGTRSGLSYKPVPQIVAALEEAFHLSFETVPSSGKRYLVALDVSASMGWSYGEGSGPNRTPLLPVEIGAALTLTLLHTEPQTHVVGFATQIRDLGITKADSLKTAVQKGIESNFGGTNTAAAIRYALEHNIEVDTFVIITDGNTWAGPQHTHQALAEYRRKTGIPARLVSLATESSGFSIADPSDGLSLDIPGFSADVPSVITNFSAGEF
jgi:60 kDa SS-A/Ro ribonucleoprotein